MRSALCAQGFRGGPRLGGEAARWEGREEVWRGRAVLEVEESDVHLEVQDREGRPGGRLVRLHRGGAPCLNAVASGEAPSGLGLMRNLSFCGLSSHVAQPNEHSQH